MIRLAEYQDMDQILNIYQLARDFMQKNGNRNQWANNHPPRNMLENDISHNNLYVCVHDYIIHGVFAFIIGEDSTYIYIENGAWKNDEIYGTIHRIASDGVKKGIFTECIEYCKMLINNIRIDTHQDNLIMQHLIQKNGFDPCGIIYVHDGSPRLAYQFVK